ncbi:hypothetical protein [Nocardioides sp. B-3]|uniref:hypothetical protein n=1 Tax=Nocardioides sp. B-3 TaxID=2895565 RepID=UPI0021527FE0|nr:hypothetical protein [Nocardioides sp. B-3]UUZ57800.1 hypothetical protein LP418_15470 [Nocardioides sp. B-3]
MKQSATGMKKKITNMNSAGAVKLKPTRDRVFALLRELRGVLAGAALGRERRGHRSSDGWGGTGGIPRRRCRPRYAQ